MGFLDALKPNGATRSRANADVENAGKVKEDSARPAGNSLSDIDIRAFLNAHPAWPALFCCAYKGTGKKEPLSARHSRDDKTQRAFCRSANRPTG
jgi:hypothetical protein